MSESKRRSKPAGKPSSKEMSYANEEKQKKSMSSRLIRNDSAEEHSQNKASSASKGKRSSRKARDEETPTSPSLRHSTRKSHGISLKESSSSKKARTSRAEFSEDVSEVRRPLETSVRVNSHGEIECSIEETNALRQSLGLKPLEVDKMPKPSRESKELKAQSPPIPMAISDPTKGREVSNSSRIPATSPSSTAAVPSIWSADDDADDLDPAAWVQKQRKREQEQRLLAQQVNHTGAPSSFPKAENFSDSIPCVEYSDSDEETEGTLTTRRGRKSAKRGDQAVDSPPPPVAMPSSMKASSASSKFHVTHDLRDFEAGNEVILTLTDKPILDEAGELRDDVDELENIHMAEALRLEKRLKDKAQTSVYNPLQEDEVGPDGILIKRDILEHYDEWAEGAKPKPLRKGFELLPTSSSYTMDAFTTLQQNSTEEGRMGGIILPTSADLNVSDPSLDAFAPVKIRKLKRSKPKGNIRKNEGKEFWDDVFNQDTAEPEEEAHFKSRNTASHPKEGSTTEAREAHALDSLPQKSSQPMDISFMETSEADAAYREEPPHIFSPPLATETQWDEEANEDTSELYELLARQRRRHTQQVKMNMESALDAFPLIKNELKEETSPTMAPSTVSLEGKAPSLTFDVKKEEEFSSGMQLTATTEFCKTVQTPLEKLESLKTESYTGAALYRQQQAAESKENEEKRKRSLLADHSDSDMEQSDTEIVGNSYEEESSDDDTMEFLREDAMDVGLSSAVNYLKQKGDLTEDKGRTDRNNSSNAPIHMSTTRGDIKLDYKDHYGRVMTPKEAFRQISWIFHGKGPGKQKLQSKLKRMELEKRLKDNPLEALPTLQALKKQQENEKTPHLILSGRPIQH
ncbi:SART-1 family protein [Cardiosporidium cionae]|uniref:SART-1 family protein n=1 Tax=Cardiosporidium cionae TaxID=476202 RepID=A0ABQ7JAC1_9APIC|nr:SART-1 family protein [Cardiosporidium cionae]|eukprot:KAF8820958.1 SART-1 family protein [Cardiosporidium cionae]